MSETVVSKIRTIIEENNLRGLWLPSVTITKAPDHGNNPGCLYMKDSNTKSYIGRITRDNQVRTITPLSQEIKDQLRVVAVGGKEALATIGKLQGSCCFCGRTLEDPESVELGYGPVCARKYGLPHTNRHGF